MSIAFIKCLLGHYYQHLLIKTESDSVGGIVEAGCVKCCSYCRLSPMGSAVCWSELYRVNQVFPLEFFVIVSITYIGGVLIGVFTLFLYLIGAGLCEFFLLSCMYVDIK